MAVPGGTENNGIYFDTPSYYIPSDMVSIRVKVPDKPLLNTPNVSGVTSTTHSVSFAWDTIQGASSYEYRLYKEGGDDIIDSGITTQRTYTSQYVLSATTLYKLMVKAISGDDAHADSLFGSATIETKEEYFYVYKLNEAATTPHDTVATAAYDFVSGSSLTDRRKPLVVDSTPLEGWRAVIEYDDWKYYLVRPIITVNSKTTNSITISWSSAIYNSDVVSGTITYYVEAYLGETQVFSETASTLTKQITGLTPGTTYAIKVTAKSSDEHVIQSESEVSSVKTKTILATPTGLTASGVTTTTDRVQWSLVANASSYDIYWYIGTVGNGSYVGSGSTTSTSYNITGLTKNTNYYFKVKANGSGDFVDSDWSDYCGFTTPNSIKITGVSFTYTSTTSTSARFDWSWDDDEMKSHCGGYKIYTGTTSSNLSYYTETYNANTTTYTLNNLSPGSTVYFGVVAKKNSDDYEDSDMIVISAMTLVKNPQITGDTCTPTVITANTNVSSLTWTVKTNTDANGINYTYPQEISAYFDVVTNTGETVNTLTIDWDTTSAGRVKQENFTDMCNNNNADSKTYVLTARTVEDSSVSAITAITAYKIPITGLTINETTAMTNNGHVYNTYTPVNEAVKSQNSDETYVNLKIGWKTNYVNITNTTKDKLKENVKIYRREERHGTESLNNWQTP